MERSRSYRMLVVFLLALFSGASGYSQNMLQEGNMDLEAAAHEEAERWTLELAMTAKQTALMEDKLVEYALKENQVLHSKMREEVKARMLTDLKLAENKSMRDILTKIQYDRYLVLERQEAQQKVQQQMRADTLD